MIPIQVRLVIYAALTLSVFAGGYWLYDHVYDKGYNQHKLEAAAATAKVYKDHAAELILKGIENDKNRAIIDDLTDAAGRVRISFPRPRCPSTATASAGTDGSAGELHNAMDKSFREFQDEVGAIIKRCDQLNIDAIRSNQ